MISEVTPDTLPGVWLAVRDQITKGLSRGAGDTTSEEHIYQSVLAGSMKMWAIHEDSHIEVVVVLSLQQRRDHKTLFVELVAGHDMEKHRREVEALLKDYADIVGAPTIEAMCRKGLSRILDTWKTKAILMELK